MGFDVAVVLICLRVLCMGLRQGPRELEPIAQQWRQASVTGGEGFVCGLVLYDDVM